MKSPKAAENVDKTGDFWIQFINRVRKLEAPLTKNLLNLINRPLSVQWTEI